MGVIISTNISLRSITKRIKIFLIIFFLSNFSVILVHPTQNSQQTYYKTIASLSKEVEIPPESDYSIKFSPETFILEESTTPYSTNELPDKLIKAIVKSPQWIQRDLLRQLQSLENPDDYIDLLLKAEKSHTDELAFCIANSPLGEPPQINFLHDNIYHLFKNANLLRYVTLENFDDLNGNYYTTINYTILDNKTVKTIKLPKEIYYWYIVHPELLGGNAKHVYGKSWREYLFNHNDRGYPLLLEKLSNIHYLWDNTSYSQSAYRQWTSWITAHPTAIEAISYWIGKTVPHEAYGDRPSQPNLIAHQHNGWCGELQRIAVSALRAGFIPAVGVSNIGEDHVWREFYERGWHQNDNWWADTGGTVNIPDIYTYGWGKNMSSVYAWKGDGSIYEVTSRYIREKDRVKVTFILKDGFGNPIDGAIICVLVKGIKDITWYKNKIWDRIEEFWDHLPDTIKKGFVQILYEKIDARFHEIPNTTDGVTISVWNFTNIHGECSIDLGKNHDYVFLIQPTNLISQWPFFPRTRLKILNDPRNTTYNLRFADFSHKPLKFSVHKPKNNMVWCNLSFSTTAYQLQKNIINNDVGRYEYAGLIDCFIMDSNNYHRYKQGKSFICYHHTQDKATELNLKLPLEEWYLVFNNDAQRTHIILNFSETIQAPTEKDIVYIDVRENDLFEYPIFHCGDPIQLSGYATDICKLLMPEGTLEIHPVDNHWEYLWDTTGLLPSNYTITACCGLSQDIQVIRLIDVFPPTIVIKHPASGTIIRQEPLIISGYCYDNTGIQVVDVAIDNGTFITTQGREKWSIKIDFTPIDAGLHTLNIRARDLSKLETRINLSLIVNRTGYKGNITIHEVFHLPIQPINTSNIVIYANTTSLHPFNIKQVFLYLSDGVQEHVYEMFQYANNPIQERHIEDPLFNQTNNPVFGIELGQFKTGQTIFYSIIVFDEANNKKQSETRSFTVKTI